jgi:hypothetical protein
MGGSTTQSELSRHLRTSAFPAARDGLLAEATTQHATPAMLDILGTLPTGQVFADVREVWASLDGHDPHAAAHTDSLTAADR